jgi:cytochrome P450
MRIEPPGPVSSTHCLTENAKINGIDFLKGDTIGVCVKSLGHLKDEWIEPEKYIPERFDPESPYHLTPSGKRRDPMTFGPFLGGRRVCIGKSFADIVSKIVGASLLASFDFEFVDRSHYIKKPLNDLFALEDP